MKQCRKFSPSPRLIPKVYREKIRIEPPPPMEKREEPSMLLTIGPSMTMALPMLLGCLVSVYGYQGQRTGTFLYMGLITAGSAALLGTFWAFLSSRRSRKVFLRKEEERQRAYREYIRQIEELLKERSRYNTAVLHRLYPSAEHAALLDSSCREFWSRTHRQEDYLYVRLGLGKLPFQSEIEIPERHFRICPDPLEEEPGRLKNTFEWLYDV
ncbi:MAG: hypothetical protein Q4B22_10210, partial [Eubacteriales bacterium]|nr:hypothetical protein [Eubacteriales bacterium]